MPSPQYTQKHWCCTHFTGEEREAGKSVAACPKPPRKGGADLETQSVQCDSMSYCVPIMFLKQILSFQRFSLRRRKSKSTPLAEAQLTSP